MAGEKNTIVNNVKMFFFSSATMCKAEFNNVFALNHFKLGRHSVLSAGHMR